MNTALTSTVIALSLSLPVGSALAADNATESFSALAQVPQAIALSSAEQAALQGKPFMKSAVMMRANDNSNVSHTFWTKRTNAYTKANTSHRATGVPRPNLPK